MLEALAARVLGLVGIEGVSTVVLLVLVSMALYAHKAASVGGRVATAGSTVQHDLKVVAVVLLVLLILGVVHADTGRAQELVAVAERRLAEARLLERAVRWVS